VKHWIDLYIDNNHKVAIISLLNIFDRLSIVENRNVKDVEIPASFVLPFGHQVLIYLELSFIAAIHKV
jgi:hypothetical protein